MNTLFRSLFLINMIFITGCKNKTFQKNDSNQKAMVKNDTTRFFYRDTVVNGIRFTIPDSISKFEKILQRDILEESQNKYCSDKEGGTSITYRVSHFSDTLISIIKKVEIECSNLPSDVIYEKGLNFLLKANSIYKINYIFSTSEKLHIKQLITENFDQECLAENEDTGYMNHLEYVIQHNSLLLINPFKSKLCSKNILFSPINYKNFQNTFLFRP